MTDPNNVLKRIINHKTNEAIYRAYSERAALLASTVADPQSPEEGAYLVDAEFYRLAAELASMSARELTEPITTTLEEGNHE